MLQRRLPFHLPVLTALWLAAGFAAPALAQTQAEIDSALTRLSEILGALSHLETICEPAALRGGLDGTTVETGAARSREDMEALLASEELSTVRQSVLVDAYNRGFRAVANTHQRCTSASERLIGLHHQRGSTIVEDLLGAAQNRALTADGPAPDEDAEAEDGSQEDQPEDAAEALNLPE
ncbi:MAG: TIGR02301 family protein [Devosiaceae bacterium]|nr:TIGR02301 family protein [Devosiaceae bacterium MH13]